MATLEQGNTEQVSGFKASCHSKCNKSKAIHGVNHTRPLKDGSSLVPQSLETHIIAQTIPTSPSLSHTHRSTCPRIMLSWQWSAREGRKRGGERRDGSATGEQQWRRSRNSIHEWRSSIGQCTHTYLYTKMSDPLYDSLCCSLFTAAWKWYQLTWWYVNQPCTLTWWYTNQPHTMTWWYANQPYTLTRWYTRQHALASWSYGEERRLATAA